MRRWSTCIRSSIIAAIVSLLVSGCTCRDAGNDICIKVDRIWNSEKHCAFTSLAEFNGRYYVAFREAGSHIFEADGTARGQIRVLQSRNGRKWKSVACLAKDGYDLRDPSLSVTPDGRLLVSMGGSVYVDKKLVGRDPMYSESLDGHGFSTPEPIEIKSPNATGED